MVEQYPNMNSSDLEKYLSGDFSFEKKEKFEDGLGADSFESEAIEGFKSLENDELGYAAIQEVKKQVAKRTGLKKEVDKVFPIWKFLGIAASLALFLMGVFFINSLMKKETSVARVDMAEEPSYVPDTTATLMVSSIDSNPTLGIDLDEELVLDDFQADLLIAKEVESLEDEADDFEEQEMGLIEVEHTEIVAEDDSILFVSADDNQANQKTANSLKVDTAIKDSLAAADILASNSSYYFDLGKTYYASKAYTKAIDNFLVSIEDMHRVTDSHYYIAMCYYKLEEGNKSSKFFDQVLKNNNSPLRDNALWYQAIILEEKGDLAGAKLLLQELANGISGFKNQAADKLNNF